MRIVPAFVVLVAAMAAGSGARAGEHVRPGLAAKPAPTEFSAQERRRPRVRIFRRYDERGVYPSYFPGPNAVRECDAYYVQEFRPSGTVITPRMRCAWRPG